jgi:predicted TIM-barrel fold metal-dependent hydrolase
VGAIVGHADLRMGAAVRDVLQAHMAISPRFRGIRQVAVWDADPDVASLPDLTGPDLYTNAKFREGFAQLAPLGLMYDAYHYHTQIPYLTALARAFPETTIVHDHLGTPIGVGTYAGRRDEIFQQWKRDLTELATCENVVMKLGGMLMPWNGFGWETHERPATSDQFVEALGRYYRHAIETFGPDRCMFESNFPVDKIAISYPVLWNAFKKLAADYSEAEKDALFSGTAMRVYRLGPIR